MPVLDSDQLYRALVARDARFDGVFFVGVTSTGIYCRPVCRAATPRPTHCRYFSTAAAAERRGFRPCLRCRPELAPGDGRAWDMGDDAASVDAVRQLARAAVSRILAGELNDGGLETLATELRVSTRHLRRAMEREFGVTPIELAQTQRLLLAKRLLGETDLPISRIALTSGFGSVRRFNALFRDRYRLAPSAVRRTTRARGADATRTSDAATTDSITLTLAYRPPFDWDAVLSYLALRAIPGVECVTIAGRGAYARSVELHGHRGFIVVTRPASASAGASRSDRAHALEVRLSTSLLPVLVPLLARVRRLFDLDADPDVIAAHLRRDRALKPLLARYPGLRVAGAMDGFELALRAILGQQVSVRGATTLAGRLVQRFAEPIGADIHHRGARAVDVALFPVTAERLADATVEAIASIGLPRSRAASVLALAHATANGELPELASDAPIGAPAEFMRRFAALPGIGAWTAAYVAMRVLHWPDAFPEGDLGLRKAMGGLSPARLRRAAEPWRPWRAYAAQYLWASLT
ncbi:MAG TPA: AlkA N-terminal domain-containing protein [Gemmatimonadaceae bacterium]